MGCPETVEIEDNLTFAVTTRTPSTSAVTDADIAPTYRVYEDETGTAILTGSMAKLDDANTTGFYAETIACTAANGFEVGKSYTVYVEAVVGGVTDVISYGFKPVDTETAIAAISATLSTVSSNVSTLLSRIPAALFAGITSLANWLGAMAGKHVADATAITEINATGAGSGTFSATTDSQEAIRDNQSASAVTVTPLSATVSAGEVTANDITAYQYTEPSYTWAITDSAGNAVDLSGTDLRFIVYQLDGSSTLFELTTGGGDISVGGDDSNEVTVTVPDSELETAGTYKYAIRNMTGDSIVATGAFEIYAVPDGSA